MKWMLLLVIGLSDVSAQERSAAIPVPYSLDRYQHLMDKSPFTKESPVDENTVEIFGKDIVLISHFQIANVLYLTILDKKSQQRINISSTEDSKAKFKAVCLINNDNPFKVQAVIKRGSETAQISYEKSTSPGGITIANPTGKQTNNTPKGNALALVTATPPAKDSQPKMPLRRHNSIVNSTTATK